MSKSLKKTLLLPPYAAIRSEIIKLEKSADPHAYFKLGTLYLEIDEEKALYYYQQAAEKGHRQAQYILGYCYLNGKGEVKNTREALKWIIASVKQGNPDAQYELAIFYATGNEVKKDQEEALRLFCQAVNQGSAEALSTFTKYYILIAAARYYKINGGMGSLLVNWNWQKDLDDFQKYSDKMNIAKLENFNNALNCLGSITRSESHTINASSLEQINEVLISADSPVRKTEIQITICRALLDGLQNNRFGKIAPEILTCFITAGIINLLIRQLNTLGIISMSLESTPFGISYLEIDEEGMKFSGVVSISEDDAPPHLEAKKQKSYKLMRLNTIKIDLKEIETVINRYLDNIPYTHLVKSFIPFMIKSADNLNSAAIRKRFTENDESLNNYKKVYSFFYAIKKPFLKAKDRILNQERKELLPFFDEGNSSFRMI